MKKIICLMMALIYLIPVLTLVGCTSKTSTPEVEYTLLEDATFIYKGVKYGLSDKGIIALEVVDKTLTEVTVYGYCYKEGISEATDAFMAAAEAEAVPYKEVYSIASGFLDNNDTIEYLILPDSLSLGYFEEDSICGCDNLKRVKLYNSFLSAFDRLRIEKKAFSLADDTVFSVCDLKNVREYATGLESLGKRLVYDRDVYFVISADVEHSYSGVDTVLEYVNATYEVTVRVLGGKRRKIWFYQRSPEDKYVEQIAAEGDPVKYNGGKDKIKIKFTLEGCVDMEAWILKNHMPFDCEDDYSSSNSLFSFERNYSSERVSFDLELESYLTFRSNGDRD